MIRKMGVRKQTTPEPLHVLQVSGLVPGGTPAPPERDKKKMANFRMELLSN